MAPPKKSRERKGRGGGNSPSDGTRGRKNRLTGRKVVALGILIVLPLGLIIGVLGSIGTKSNSNSSANASANTPGLSLMTQACAQLSTLAQNAGAITGTGGTTTTAAGTKTPGGSSPTAADNSTAASNLLTGMQRVAQLAANAAGTSSAWQPMATDVGKLNDMIQSGTGDDTSFSTQLQTVGQECSAVVGATTSTPGTS